MNGQEKTQLDVVANDIKWIMEALVENKECHKEIQKDIRDNFRAVQKNTTFRKIGTWIVSVLVLTVIGFFVKILTGGD